VSCAASTATTEGNRNLQAHTIVAVAKSGTAGTASYDERQLTVIASRYKHPSGTSPRYACP